MRVPWGHRDLNYSWQWWSPRFLNFFYEWEEPLWQKKSHEWGGGGSYGRVFSAWRKLVLYELQGNCRETFKHSFCSADTTLLFSFTRCPDGRKVSPFAGECNSRLILPPPHPKLKLANLSQDTKLYFSYFLGFSPSSNIEENISTIKFQSQICIFYIGRIYHKKREDIKSVPATP